MEPSAAGLVIFNKLLTRVVLVTRSSAPFPGRRDWELPKGGMRDDENIFEAALREVQEETGIIGAELEVAWDVFQDATIKKGTIRYWGAHTLDFVIPAPEARDRMKLAKWFVIEQALDWVREAQQNVLRDVFRACRLRRNRGDWPMKTPVPRALGLGATEIVDDDDWEAEAPGRRPGVEDLEGDDAVEEGVTASEDRRWRAEERRGDFDNRSSCPGRRDRSRSSYQSDPHGLLVRRTPQGKPICYNYNTRGGCSTTKGPKGEPFTCRQGLHVCNFRLKNGCACTGLHGRETSH